MHSFNPTKLWHLQLPKQRRKKQKERINLPLLPLILEALQPPLLPLHSHLELPLLLRNQLQHQIPPQLLLQVVLFSMEFPLLLCNPLQLPLRLEQPHPRPNLKNLKQLQLLS